jgi:DNA (cytosine-5)-methyltransferase 1
MYVRFTRRCDYRRINMAVRYVKLWKLLLDKGLKKTDLISQAGISSNVLAKLGRDEFVAMESISKICKALSCDVGDIMEIVDEEK